MITVACLEQKSENLKPVLNALMSGVTGICELEQKLRILFQCSEESPEWEVLDSLLTELVDRGFLICLVEMNNNA